MIVPDNCNHYWTDKEGTVIRDMRSVDMIIAVMFIFISKLTLAAAGLLMSPRSRLSE